MRKILDVLPVLAAVVMVLVVLGLIAFGGERAPFNIKTFVTPREDGVPAYLWVQITIPEDQMLYAMKQGADTLVTALKITPAGNRVGEFEHIGPPPKVKVANGVLVYYHTGQATYNAPIRGRPETISGTIRYGLCGEDFCLPPVTVPFSARINK